ncbi:MAG: energy transducer TonB [Acidobacteriota bacterium]
MNRLAIVVAVLSLVGYPPAHLRAAMEPIAKPAPIALQTPLRIALIGFSRAKATGDSVALDSSFAEAFGRDSRVVLIDHSMMQPALSGIGYEGSINMSKEEARRLAAAIGCDFFIVGKAEALTRSEVKNESHEEAFAGVMIVDGRTGSLAVFFFVSEKAATREGALRAVARALGERAPGYIDSMIQIRTPGPMPALKDSGNSGDVIEDMPEEDSPRAAGFKPPQFLSRVKPGYTSEAEQADITATVEVMAVFRSNGEVGGVEITRWAGFGLDESAVAAVRQLKYAPATRDGNPVNIRAMIRYNFRRVNDVSQPQEQLVPKPPDNPERDLRQLFKPTYRRP